MGICDNNTNRLIDIGKGVAGLRYSITPFTNTSNLKLSVFPMAYDSYANLKRISAYYSQASCKDFYQKSIFTGRERWIMLRYEYIGIFSGHRSRLWPDSAGEIQRRFRCEHRFVRQTRLPAESQAIERRWKLLLMVIMGGDETFCWCVCGYAVCHALTVSMTSPGLETSV